MLRWYQGFESNRIRTWKDSNGFFGEPEPNPKSACCLNQNTNPKRGFFYIWTWTWTSLKNYYNNYEPEPEHLTVPNRLLSEPNNPFNFVAILTWTEPEPVFLRFQCPGLYMYILLLIVSYIYIVMSQCLHIMYLYTSLLYVFF